MADRKRISPLHSLKTQLCLGSIVLLSTTIAIISYALILHQESILKNEIEHSLTLLGRNIVLSSERLLLREDPEFELFPLVKRIIKREPSVISLVITDSEGTILGHDKLNLVSKKYKLNLRSYEPVASNDNKKDEIIFQNKSSYFFISTIKSKGKPIGKIYLQYSKRELNKALKRGVLITLICSTAVLILGIFLALTIFRRISHPKDDLIRGVENLGLGKLDTRIIIKSKNEFKVLADSFNNMACRIARAQKDLIQKKRMEREIELARDIQISLIPASVFQPPGYEIGAYYMSATEVGGDYYDVMRLSDGRVGLVIADVSGKGVPGMVVMAMVKTMVQELSNKILSPKELIISLNSSLSGNIKKNMFVTMFYSVLDTEQGILTFSNAGHNPLLLYRHCDRRCDFLKMAGMPIGIIPQKHFESALKEYRISLAECDLILQYTDGLSEAKNQNGLFMELDGIMALCEVHAHEGANKLVRELAKYERSFRKDLPQADDITILALSRKEPVLCRETIERQNETHS